MSVCAEISQKSIMNKINTCNLESASTFLLARNIDEEANTVMFTRIC